MENKQLFEQLFEKNKKAFYQIVGDTGSGKTTLLKVLFYENLLVCGGGIFISDRGVGEELQEIINICKERESDLILLDFVANNNAELINIDIEDIVKTNKILIINYNELSENSVVAKNKIKEIQDALIKCKKSKKFLIFCDKSWKNESDLDFVKKSLLIKRVTNIVTVITAFTPLDIEDSKTIYLKSQNSEELLNLRVGEFYLNRISKNNKFNFKKL